MDTRITFYQQNTTKHVYVVFSSVSPRQIQIRDAQHLAWPALSLERTYPWSMTPCRWFADSDLAFYRQISHEQAAALYPYDIIWIDQVAAALAVPRHQYGKRVSSHNFYLPKILTELVKAQIAFTVQPMPGYEPDELIIVVARADAERLKAIIDPILEHQLAQVFQMADCEEIEIRLDGLATVGVKAKTADDALALVEGHVMITTDDQRIQVYNAGEWNFEIVEEGEGD
jgi:hypothetical protein